MSKLQTWILICTLLISTSSKAEELMVAVASNFSQPMQQIVSVFEQNHQHKVVLVFGSSGKIFAQIVNGAPYDVFFSADQAKPQALIDRELAISASHFTYALGVLALWSADSQKIADNSDVLVQGKFNKLALANPKLAPYGLAASEVLSSLHLLNATRSHWVQGENIAQTYQFVASHNADIGFVALAQIMQNGTLSHGSAWIIPSSLYRPIKQDAVMLNRAKNNSAAKDLMNFMSSPITTRIIQSYGYKLEQQQR